jgi:hypothetical protein
LRAPVPLSEVVTTQSVRPHGTIGLTLGGGSATQVVLADGSAGRWAARVARMPGRSSEVLVSTQIGATLLGSQRVRATQLPGGRLGLRLQVTAASGRPSPPVSSGPGVASLIAPAAQAPFAVIASDGVALDLRAMSFEH